jgi:hypothetical protein
MEKTEIILFLKMLNQDRSYKEFYFSPGSEELNSWLSLKEEGLVVMKNIENTTKYHIAFSDYGFSFIEDDSDTGDVSSIMEQLS